MAQSLQPHATSAQESIRLLEGALATSRAQWDDSTRQSFDQRHAEVIVVSGKNAARKLAEFAQELTAALASLSR